MFYLLSMCYQSSQKFNAMVILLKDWSFLDIGSDHPTRSYFFSWSRVMTRPKHSGTSSDIDTIYSGIGFFGFWKMVPFGYYKKTGSGSSWILSKVTKLFDSIRVFYIEITQTYLKYLNTQKYSIYITWIGYFFLSKSNHIYNVIWVVLSKTSIFYL